MEYKLEVIKPISYVSPSSYLVWKTCQMKTYLTRLANNPYIHYETSPAMALGTIVDAYFKDHINTQLFKNPRYRFDVLIKQNLNYNGENRVQLLEQGKHIAEEYIRYGYMGTILNRITGIDIQIYKQHHTRNGYIIPILGIIDAVLDHTIPFDWKTKGFFSSGNQSFTPGYTGSIQYKDSLNNVSYEWATQMTIYSWLLNNKNNHRFMMHEILPNNRVATFDSTIEDSFEYDLECELEKMWDQIHGRDYRFCFIDKPIPSQSLCMKYGTLCAAATYCDDFKIWMENQCEQ